jgi:hypothetical protein
MAHTNRVASGGKRASRAGTSARRPGWANQVGPARGDPRHGGVVPMKQDRGEGYYADNSEREPQESQNDQYGISSNHLTSHNARLR